ncbi:hypothetical protein [Burkholderia sp. D-99]|uniref:hypothetical protein n=1 Tax=Burkholderia sp. D-99 TaxID=2717316 RepID=UPI0014227585|nr:hypothetical protein [Burkholderia sp. D-99]NHV29591.1 hypothetical protein [Burkholderia sp. D-99]
MRNLDAVIEEMKVDWSAARKAIHFSRECPFLLRSCFSDGVASDVVIDGIPDSAHELMQFWIVSERADLFKDDECAQWGVEIFSPQKAVDETGKKRKIRGREFVDGDIVFARFYGDSDLLLMDFTGSVYVSLPLDNRCDWPRVADSLGDFLERLTSAQGAKYWEPPKSSR